MKGMFLKSPTVRMGSQNYMRGTTETLTSSRDIGGCALIEVDLRGPGGGGGGAAIRLDGSGNPISSESADGERGNAGTLITGSVVSVRPATAGYVHRSGGARGNTQVVTYSAPANGTDGSSSTAASLAGITAGAGSGGRRGQASNVSVTGYSSTALLVTNPDGSSAGRGGDGANRLLLAPPTYGATNGQSSRAWMTILD